MEGTLGAVDRVSLRGDVREAALQGTVSRKRGYAGRACGWTLGNEGASSRMATPAIRESRFATGGVRADQVGEKLPLRAIAVGRGLNVGKPQKPLACEYSVGWGSDKGFQSLKRAAKEETPAQFMRFGRSSGCARVIVAIARALNQGSRFR